MNPGTMERIKLYQQRANNGKPLFDGIPYLPPIKRSQEEREAYNAIFRDLLKQHQVERATSPDTKTKDKIRAILGSGDRPIDWLVDRLGITEQEVRRMIDEIVGCYIEDGICKQVN